MTVETGKLVDLDGRLPPTIDVFICSASFETRCRSIPDSIDAGRPNRVLIIENEDYRDLHVANATYLLERFGDTAETVMLNTGDPIRTADNLQRAVERCGQCRPGQIVVDVTTLTKESLLILFGLLVRQAGDSQVLFLYSPASDYSVGDPPENKWLSRGVVDVRSVLGYPGELLPTRVDHLILLVGGFEHDRAIDMIGQCEPRLISLGYSHTSDPSRLEQQEASRRSFRMVRAIYGDAREFAFDCHNPYRTRDAILKQRRLDPDANTIVSTFNTKISTIGAAMAATEDRSIQLSYAQAEIYNIRHFSSPGDTYYLFHLREPA